MAGIRARGRWSVSRSKATAGDGRGQPAVAIGFLVLLASVCRLFTQRTGGSSLGDMGFWYGWSLSLNAGDWRHFYAATGCDYLPGYLYVLWCLGEIHLWLEGAPGLVRTLAPSADLLYKLPAMIADVATVVLIYVAGRRWGREGAGMLAAASYAVSPGIIFNSSRWGQVDSVPAFLMVLAIVLQIEDHAGWGGVALGLSMVCKPTALVLVGPCIVFLALRRDYKGLLGFGVGGLVPVLGAFAPFVPRNTNLMQFIDHQYTFIAGEFPFLTVNAFNAWLLDQGHLGLVPTASTVLGIDDHVFGWAMLGILGLGLCLVLTVQQGASERRHMLLPVASTLLVGFFMLLTGMHERHLLPALPMLALTCVCWPRFWVPYIWLSLGYFLNLRFVFFRGQPYGQSDLTPSTILSLAVLNLTMLVMLVILLVYMVRHPRASHDPAGGSAGEPIRS